MKNRIVEIDFLRSYAALSVVFYHIYYVFKIYNPFNLIFAEYGFLGVEIFFMISGYVMSLSMVTNISALKFIKNRIKRIYPQYIIVTLILAPIFYIKYNSLNLEDLIYSLLLIPHKSDYDGLFHPILGVGWTLQFEMLFYIILTIFIFFKVKYPTIISLLSIFIISLLINNLISIEMLRYIFDPLVYIYFIIGAIIYRLKSYNRIYYINLFLISIAIFIFNVNILDHNESNQYVRFSYSLSIFLFPFVVHFALFKYKIFIFLASISYELYLVHHPIISIIGKLAGINYPFWFFSLISIITCIIVAYIYKKVFNFYVK